VGDVGFSTDLDGWIARVGAAGTIDAQWSYSGQKNGMLHTIASTADGGYIAAGQTDFDGSYLRGDGWLMKLDKDLAPKWSKAYDLGQAPNDFRLAACLSDGGFLLAGRSSDSDGASSLVARANATGGMAWAIKIEKAIFDAMIPTPDKGLLALVQDTRDMNFFPTLIRLDATGKVKWARQIADDDYTFHSGFLTSSGDFVIGGSSGSQNLVMKVSGGGALKWQSAFGPTFSYLTKIFAAPGGGAYFVTSSTQVVVAKVTAAGGLSFARGYAPFTSMIQESADHAFQATDGSLLMLCNYVSDTAIVRFDANGKTSAKCDLFPITYKKTNPKLALEDIGITPKKVKLTVKTANVTRVATTARLEDACK
jgi:hypothetical protein